MRNIWVSPLAKKDRFHTQFVLLHIKCCEVLRSREFVSDWYYFCHTVPDTSCSANAGAVAGGVVVAVSLILATAVVTAIVIVVVLRNRRYSCKNDEGTQKRYIYFCMLVSSHSPWLSFLEKASNQTR